MNRLYQSPNLEWIRLGREDVLTLSDDNDAPFFAPSGENSTNNGWSGYH